MRENLKVHKSSSVLLTRSKALELNLNEKVYGTVAEIGGGQEVARHFFRAGMASNTIAKTMSAYDMAFSDAIYGKEESGRYVCESRLIKMLDREYSLLAKRLDKSKAQTSKFFAFANTVAIKSDKVTGEGHGWMGLFFQTSPEGPPQQMILHVRLFDEEVINQQSDLGVLGVNLIYACFFHIDDPERFIRSLMDNLSPKRVEIDLVRSQGEHLKHFNNLLLGRLLVEKGSSMATLIGIEGRPQVVSEALYKKCLIVSRPHQDGLSHTSAARSEELSDFLANRWQVPKAEIIHWIELGPGQLNAQLDTHLPQVPVLLTQFSHPYQLAQYLSRTSKRPMAFVFSPEGLESLFADSGRTHLPGGLLEYVGRLFRPELTVVVDAGKQKVEGRPLAYLKGAKENERLILEYLVREGKIVEV